MNDKLKPCPFCGVKTDIAEISFFQYKIVGAHGVDCPFFYMTWTIFFDTPEEAAEAWNRRPNEERKENEK